MGGIAVIVLVYDRYHCSGLIVATFSCLLHSDGLFSLHYHSFNPIHHSFFIFLLWKERVIRSFAVVLLSQILLFAIIVT
jgi:hypothetical protein